jgi:hypothetical protein
MTRIRLSLLSLLAVFAVSGVASTSASALCSGVAPQHKCEWNPGNGVVETVNNPETVTFTLENTVSKLKVECKKVFAEGEVTNKTKNDTVKTVKFTGCTTGGGAACVVKTAGEPNGTVVVTKATTTLTERNTNVLADEFVGSGAGSEFVTLHFEEGGLAGCTAKKPNYPGTTKVEGQVAAECKQEAGSTTVVVLNFPATPLGGNALTAFGTAATLKGGPVKEKLTAGGNLDCV